MMEEKITKKESDGERNSGRSRSKRYGGLIKLIDFEQQKSGKTVKSAHPFCQVVGLGKLVRDCPDCCYVLVGGRGPIETPVVTLKELHIIH